MQQSPHIDWSYQSRKNKKKLKFDPNQTLITDYMSIATKVQDVLQYVHKEIPVAGIDLQEGNSKFSTTLFKKLMTNAQNNCASVPKGRRHSEIMKNFPYHYC